MHEAYGGFHMAHSVVHLTQSRYYSPAFNAAVFDGPIRIYFAQHQETLALQVYFRLQQYLDEMYASFRNSFRQHGKTIFLMLYPNHESFFEAFAMDEKNVICGLLGGDHVVGVNGPLSDEEYDSVFAQIRSILESLGMATPNSLPEKNPEVAGCAAP